MSYETIYDLLYDAINDGFNLKVLFAEMQIPASDFEQKMDTQTFNNSEMLKIRQNIKKWRSEDGFE